MRARALRFPPSFSLAQRPLSRRFLRFFLRSSSSPSSTTYSPIVIDSPVQAGHQRTVNRVAWSPTSASLLLSASQDGSVKLWDVRDGGSGHEARQTFTLGKGFAVRDVRVSPFHPQYFATGNENGLAVIWDIRKVWGGGGRGTDDDACCCGARD